MTIRRIIKTNMLLIGVFFWTLMVSQAFAERVHVGKKAPDFQAIDTQGILHKLSDYKGKTIILEWSNPYCPYVKKHYKSGNIQALQKKANTDGYIWLTILSSAPGKSGYVKAQKAENLFHQKYKSQATTILMDETGEIGTRYGAITTPHMFVINPKGMLVYAGALDNKPSTRPSSLKGAKNYVLKTLTELKRGKAISTPQTRSYGCSIKY